MTRPVVRLLGALFLLTMLLGAHPSLAQVGASPVAPCTACRLEVRELITLGDTIGPGLLPALVQSVVRTEDGEFWVTFFRAGEPPLVFDGAGRWVRSIGRTGQGPGEVAGLVYALPYPERQDSVIVLDSGNGRASIYHASGELARSFRFPLPIFPDATAVSPDLVVVAANLPTPEAAGLPMHIVRSDGGPVHAFGADPPVMRADLPGLIKRKLARAGERQIWSVWPSRYRIERWDVSGERLSTFDVASPWFEPHWSSFNLNMDEPPPTVISDVIQHPSGLLLIAGLAPDENWRQGIRPGRMIGGRQSYEVTEDAYYDTYIEAVHPSSGEVIASLKLDESAPYFIDPFHLRSLDANLRGHPIVKIFTVELLSSTRGGVQ